MTIREMPHLIQGTEEWYNQRRGIVTASVVGQLVSTRKPSAIDHDCPNCGAPLNAALRAQRSVLRDLM